MATRLLYLQEVAERLRRSRRAVEWLVHTRAIPSGLVAGRRVVREGDLEKYIDAAFNDGEASA